MERSDEFTWVDPLSIDEHAAAFAELDPDAKRRLRAIAAMARAAGERSASPSPFYRHVLTQYDRALSASERAEDPGLRGALEHAEAAHRAGDFTAINALIRLGSFPWQRSDFAYFTSRREWRERTAQSPDSAPVCLTELDPDDPNRVVAFRSDDRPILVVFSGNRQAYEGTEHEPASIRYQQDLQAAAESYVARAGSLVAGMFERDVRQRFKIVLPVYGAVRTRHEQRLVHFAISQDPHFVHPSIDATACAIFQALFFRRAADSSLVPRTESQLLAAPFRAVTHSYGSSVVTQVVTRLRSLAAESNLPTALVDDYLARGVCVEFGGYRLETNGGGERSLVRHAVIAPLDEVALGSPGDPPRYTSPVVQPDWVWKERFSFRDLRHLARAEFDQVPCRHGPMSSRFTFWSPVLRGFEAYDDAGNKLAELESANGHFLRAYTEHTRRELPELVRLLQP